MHVKQLKKRNFIVNIFELIVAWCIFSCALKLFMVVEKEVGFWIGSLVFLFAIIGEYFLGNLVVRNIFGKKNRRIKKN